MSAPTSVRPARRRWSWLLGGAASILLLGVALAVFTPWKLVVDETVDEALPAATASPTSPRTADATGPAPVPASTSPTVVARGTFVSHEHETRGTVVVLALPDGRRILRLQDLRTSNGPDVKVWLSEAPVLPGSDGWRVFDDGAYVDLGSLKGNVGNQNYVIPASVDLGSLRSVSLWCDRFDVSFGAARLTQV